METTKTWLILEDNLTTISDIKSKLKGIKLIEFSNVNRIIEFLVDEQSKGLGDFGLLIDVMLQGSQYIVIPDEWQSITNKGTGTSRMHRTDNGYDAGIVFCEQFILNKGGAWDSFWPLPLPPIIFLTTIVQDDRAKTRVDEIKAIWGKKMNVEGSDIKVEWFRKWHLDYDELIKKLKSW